MRATAVLLFALQALLFDGSYAAPLDNEDSKQGIMAGNGRPQYQFGGLPGFQRYPTSNYMGGLGSSGGLGSMGYGGGMGFPMSHGYGFGSGSYGGYPQTWVFIPPYQQGAIQGGFPVMFRKKDSTAAKEEQGAKLRH